jgi:hypothetical protein
MKNVEVLKQVNYGGKFYNPSLKGPAVVLSVPDHTAEHWIATGAAKEIAFKPAQPEVKK